MNTIKLKGILTNISSSHEIGGVEFCKANLLVKRVDGREDLINIRFKKFSNPYNEGQEISLSGNLRSYSSKLENGKNKVDLYVFTYFDQPELNEDDQEEENSVELEMSYQFDGSNLENAVFLKDSQIKVYLTISPAAATDKTIVYKNNKVSKRFKNPEKWSSSSVRQILSNKMYTGNMVQCVQAKLNYKSMKRIRLDKNQWIEVKNTHQAIS